MNEEQEAECRGCGMKLIGKPYHLGGGARHPKTNEQCSVSFWGGYVCSDDCDRSADRKQKQSIDRYNDPIGYYS